MPPRRLVSPPPDLPGYTYVRPLGSGGFADVYCYEQHMPRRTVAVKVLLANVAGFDAQQMFLAESTVMAQLSAHPAVLTVYEASLCPDGRPYLVMEYCPSGYGDRIRTSTIPVDEALRVASAIGSVLETAHRQGVLHRDIKPSNILITQYGRPVLSDFGIASTVATAAGDDAVGLSVPWSAPEVIAGTTGGTIQSEIWSYAATVYALLAGRSPFEIPGKANSRKAVQERILGRATARPTGRIDVPPRLERALAQALTKDPAHRPASIHELLHAVQLAESDLGLRPTALDIPTEHSIDLTPGITPVLSTTRPPGSGRTRTRPRSGQRRRDTHTTRPATSGTARRAFNDASPHRRRRIAWWIVGGLALVGASTAGALALRDTDGNVPRVGTISTSASDTSIVFTWDDPGLATGDSYLVRVGDGPAESQTATTYALDPAGHTGRVCLTVTVVHGGTPGDASNPACTKVD